MIEKECSHQAMKECRNQCCYFCFGVKECTKRCELIPQTCGKEVNIHRKGESRKNKRGY
jgi:hypothetical protein